MAIELSKEIRKQRIAAIRRYFAENLEEIGDLKARMFLDFFLEEIGPSIYNKAIADAQAHMHDRVGDLDGSCYEPEYGYWKR